VHRHTRNVKNNEPESAHAQHILDNQHEYGHIQNTMTLLKACNKKSGILKLENLFIQKHSTERRLIQEQTTHEFNILFSLSKSGNSANP
jgi:hypothetical protein